MIKMTKKTLLKGAEAFVKKSDSNSAVLLLHGFKASAFEMKECAEYLHKRLKLSVSVPLLSHHGISAEELNKARWQDWYNSAENAFLELKKNYETVFIVGMSMGGSLTLQLAAKHKVKAIVCIGTPYKLPKRTIWAKALSFFIRKLDDGKGPDIADENQKEKAVSLCSIPLNALVELRKMLRAIRPLYKNVTCSVLLTHSEKDHVIAYENMEAIKSRLASEQIETESYQDSYHIIPLDKDRFALFKRIEAFLKTFL